MRLLSWNVNGIRAALGKGAAESLLEVDPDIFCLQETKARPEQVELPLELGGYRNYWNSAEKKGYSGTAIFSKEEPLDVFMGMGMDEHDNEGRVISAEYSDFMLVNVYTPNSQDGLRRLPYRMEWDKAFRNYLRHLEDTRDKPVIFCGDLNVAHHEIDIARPGQNRRSAGFSDEERESFSETLGSGFTDSFRHLHPDTAEAISDSLIPRLESASIYPEIHGSDHCPVGIVLK